jgi:hypothetical protein
MARSRTTVKKGQKGRAHPATKHGAKAQPPAVRVRAIEDALYESLAAAAPVRVANNQLPPADAHTVRLAARTLARLESVSAWLDEHGPLDAKGKPRSAANWERRLTATSAKLLASLGMNPSARARLGVDVTRIGIDLATAMSTEDPQLRAQRLAELGLGNDDGKESDE